MIRRAVDEFGHSGQMIPTVLEIPSKDTPYDPRKDGVMQRVAFFMPSAMASMGVELWENVAGESKSSKVRVENILRERLWNEIYKHNLRQDLRRIPC